MTSVKKLSVSADQSGQRLDNFLKKTLKNVRYWVVVDSVREIDNEPWFIRFKDNVEKTFPLVTMAQGASPFSSKLTASMKTSKPFSGTSRPTAST